ncbi:unnamed protein product [Rotaria sp. Silwood1]|nr:unnamed protein product [Rotaria sp. Silwood1]CAF0867890.1 unnamed protein product [Rotaria sp. Silwood1]
MEIAVNKSTNTTALQVAIFRDNLLKIQLLVKYGADIKTLNKAGDETIQQLAISTNRRDLISYVTSLINVPRN